LGWNCCHGDGGDKCILAIESGDQGVNGGVVYGRDFHSGWEAMFAGLAGEDGNIKELRFEEFLEDCCAYWTAGLESSQYGSHGYKKRVRTPAKATFLMLIS
jgi:hypothetical protein